jgi:hypothetical protein
MDELISAVNLAHRSLRSLEDNQTPIGDKRNAIDRWRRYISIANRDLPQQSVVESRYRPREMLSGRNRPKIEATWGDSFHQRIYGERNFVAADSDFDKIDFQLIFSVDRQCDLLDREIAKDLYLKIFDSRVQSVIWRESNREFFNRKYKLVQRLYQADYDETFQVHKPTIVPLAPLE